MVANERLVRGIAIVESNLRAKTTKHNDIRQLDSLIVSIRAGEGREAVQRILRDEKDVVRTKKLNRKL